MSIIPKTITKTFHVSHIEELDNITEFIITNKKSNIFFFYGDLGAGKTSFIKVLCKFLQVSDHVSSPTYALVNEYLIPEDHIYHLDLYRLKSEDEAYDMGIEEYLYSNKICFIEWPQVIEGIIDIPFHTIHITENEDQSRTIVFK